MDPNEALAKIRKLTEVGDAATTNEDAAAAYGQALEYFKGLDEWLGKGGFLPADWRRGRSV